ncbi:MAG: helix-turn-helix domain-containing protein [Flavobacteriales bacterium]|nr:helix-turn-helix domain-containing protein [Flavobacteriales bacterium]
MKYEGKTGEYFEVTDITAENCQILKASRKSELSLLWFEDDTELIIDTVHHQFKKNQFAFLTEFHKLQTKKVSNLKLLRFNRPFYCILDHDSEVGCKGILYYGSSQLPVLCPEKEDLLRLEKVWNMLCFEMESRDNLQLEMLQMMLKQVLILCTRIYKKQENFERIDLEKADILRQFNYLVETHFREKHSVSEYANLLNKSPKTISNLFKKLGDKSPLQYIQDRIMLEARRLLHHSGLPISEIGFEIGFNDVQAFSRFFRRMEGISPSDYRNSEPEGKIANSSGIST